MDLKNKNKQITFKGKLFIYLISLQFICQFISSHVYVTKPFKVFNATTCTCTCKNNSYT